MPGSSKKDFQKRLDKITEIFSDILGNAQNQIKGQGRSPYLTAKDVCTAKFGCRNQRKSRTKDGLLVCGSDDKLDYRNAWETDVC